jgi:hypothetical protein
LYGKETWSLTLRNECRGSGFSTARSWREYLNLTRRKEEVVGEHVIVKGFMTCTPRPAVSGVSKLRMVRCVGHMALRERDWRKHPLEGWRVDAGIILKLIWKNIKGVFGLDSFDPGEVKGQFLLNVVPYFPAYKTHRPIRRTMIFSLEILVKNNDKCILILVIYWKKTGLLHILLQESKPFTSSDARSHDLVANFTISR